MGRIDSRIAVLSSPDWQASLEVKVALRAHVDILAEYGNVTLVLGEGQRGAEKIAKNLWRKWVEDGFTVEHFESNRKVHGRRADGLRNQAILDSGISVALVFLTERDPALLDFIKRCEVAKVRLELYQSTSGAAHAPIRPRSGGAGSAIAPGEPTG